MGQKVHPGGMRVGVIHDWKSNWYTGKKDFPAYLIEDIKIREHITNKLSHAGLSDILIRKDKQRITVDIYTARPGIVIGKSGVEVDALRKDLHALTKKNVHININEIKRPELDAKLVAQSIAEQLQNRVSFRRAMKRALASGIRSGAKGVRIQCGGRLGGTEMSRSEAYSEGRVPLHTIRADIDYGFVEAKTTFGRIGVKVWINKGEIMPEGYGGLDTEKDVRLGEQDQARRRRANVEGLGASREGGRDRQRDREGLGPVRPSRKRGGAGRGGAGGGRGGQSGRGRPAGRGRAGQQENVERPRTDEQATSAEGREPPVELDRSRRRPPPSPTRPIRRRRSSSPKIPRSRKRPIADVAPEENEVPQAPARPPSRVREGSDDRAVRRLRPEGARDGLGHQPPDRGRPHRDDAQDQARREGLDQRLPGQADDPEAGRDAHGLRQGLARALGRRGQAGSRDVRARRRAGAARKGSAPTCRHEALGQDEIREARG